MYKNNLNTYLKQTHTRFVENLPKKYHIPAPLSRPYGITVPRPRAAVYPSSSKYFKRHQLQPSSHQAQFYLSRVTQQNTFINRSVSL